MSNYKDYKDAYMVCLRALFGDVLTLDEETFVLLDASFALVENDGDYICSKGFERWLQVQLPYIYGAFLSREDFTKNVYDVMYHFVATGKESALEKLKAKPVNENGGEPIRRRKILYQHGRRYYWDRNWSWRCHWPSFVWWAIYGSR